MPDGALNEVDTAHFLGFARFATFRRAVSSGAVPAPDIQLPDGPRWYVARLIAFLNGVSSDSMELSEADALERLRNGQDAH